MKKSFYFENFWKTKDIFFKKEKPLKKREFILRKSWKKILEKKHFLRIGM